MWKRNNIASGDLWPWFLALTSLGGLDWFLTWLLVRKGNAVEANPIAAAILRQFGWSGLLLLKVFSLVLVAVLGDIIARTNRQVALRLFQFGCACSVVIVAYSSILMMRGEVESSRFAEQENKRIAQLVERRRLFSRYIKKVHELSQKIIEERHLAQAVQELLVYLKEVEHPLIGSLGLIDAGPTVEERLAAHLICHAGYLLRHQPQAASRLLTRIQREFDSTFSCPTLPRVAMDWFPKEGESHFQESRARSIAEECPGTNLHAWRPRK